MSLRTFILSITLLFFIPIWGLANVPENTAHIVSYTSYSSSEIFKDGSHTSSTSSSTMYFNDETGALLSFEVQTDGQTMSIIIRKNGIKIWSESFKESSPHYTITRKRDKEVMSFLMQLGHRTYLASYAPDGQLIVTQQ